MNRKPKSQRPVVTERLGLAEWFGRPVWSLTPEERTDFARLAAMDPKSANKQCPFRMERCGKKGGACSFIPYAISKQPDDTCEGRPLLDRGIETFCPSRFWEARSVFRRVAKVIFEQPEGSRVFVVREVDFLKSVKQMRTLLDAASTATHPSLAAASSDTSYGEDETDDDQRGVGRMDLVMVCVDESDRLLDWCAVEMQSVYFSGDRMTPYFKALGEGAQACPPVGNRRGDYRSSGPKRLMPQLQVKVPSLSRWGKKMVVVVDDRFMGELGLMREAKETSNADIVWCIVRYGAQDGTGTETTDAASTDRFTIADMRFYKTTLEASIAGLTSGEPVAKAHFEKAILRRRSAWERLLP
jgi:hypothetical protein